MSNVFAVPIFFITFRESLETGIVVSVLLAFLRQQFGPEQDRVVYKKLRFQIWMGVLVGFLICLCVGAGIIGAFYGLGIDHYKGTENIWEGVFALLSSIIIAIMGGALLRVSKMQSKWRVKLARALEAKDTGVRFGKRVKNWGEKYIMFLLPFVTIMREGLEAVAFISGVALSLPASSIPLPTVIGLIAGFAASYLIYRCGLAAPLQFFLIISTCFLYLVAAALFSRSVWYFEADRWNRQTGGDATEGGDGPGTYDIRQSVWHVNCCSPVLNGGGGWGIFTALLGWQNSATYGTVISYNLFWLVTIAGFVAMRFNEKYGRWPFMKAKPVDESSFSKSSSTDERVEVGDVKTAGVTVGKEEKV